MRLQRLRSSLVCNAAFDSRSRNLSWTPLSVLPTPASGQDIRKKQLAVFVVVVAQVLLSRHAGLPFWPVIAFQKE
jgi:hypothetical protein